MRITPLLFVALLLAPSLAIAQMRSASPRGEAATQVGGSYDDGDYGGGSWVAVDYGRPILRGRTMIFGEGESYGEVVNSDAPVWRAGANKTTVFTTETDLIFDGEHLPAGEYSFFIDLAENEWTLILSNHIVRPGFRSEEAGLWGSFGYVEEKDALRAPMALKEAPMSFDQLTIAFVDMTKDGGTLAVMWEDVLATVEFSAANTH